MAEKSPVRQKKRSLIDQSFCSFVHYSCKDYLEYLDLSQPNRDQWSAMRLVLEKWKYGDTKYESTK